MVPAMLHLLALTLIAQQAAPASPASSLTRMLNGSPPSVASGPAPVPTPAPAPTTRAAPATTSVPVAAPSRIAPTPITPSTAPATVTRPAVSPTVAPTSTTPVPAEAAVAPAPVPVASPPPAPVVLDAPAIAALPFTLTLPAGFNITTGRPGPDFNVYTIRRGGQPFVMVYSGPASQFPIYSGEMVEAGGRASVVATEAGRRVALEHLFSRATAPREIHVWITSLDGADRLVAEQIGQSVDDR